MTRSLTVTISDKLDNHLRELEQKLNLSRSATIRLAIEFLYLMTHEKLTFIDILRTANFWRIAENIGVELDTEILEDIK